MIARRRWQKLQTILRRVALIALAILPCIMLAGSQYSAAENDSLYKKSVHLEHRSLWETEELWLVVAGIAIASVLIIGLVLLWNLTLRNRVEQRTRELARSEEELRQHRDNLEQLVQERAQGLLAANQELTAMNEEMTAMNEEMTSINAEITSLNATLEDSNRRLVEQIEFRRQIENDLILRERQYRASINLLTSSAAEIEKLFESILRDALKQVNAPGGTIGLIDETGKQFVIRHASGTAANISSMTYPAEEGVFAQVRESGEAAYMEDYQQLKTRFADHKLDRLTSLVMVPLKQQGVVIGAFTAMWNDEVHSVSAEDIEILRQFGDLASIALERANIQRKIAYQNQLLQSLAMTTTSLVGQLDVDLILQNVLKQAAELIGVPHGFIQLLEDEDEIQYIKCAMGNYSGIAGQRIPLQGLAGEVVKSGQIMLIEDYQNWEKRPHGSFFDEISMTMQAPLHSQGKVVGTLGLSAFGERVPVDSEKLAILEQYANVASIALQNAITHQKITRLAFHDTLTGLPNRAYLNLQLGEDLHKESSEAAVGAVLFIDLDDLKMVNDNFGHTSGDSVIITAGKYIVEAVGTETFVARMGGDEFIVVLAGENRRDSIQQVADRLLKSLHREYAVGAQTLHMSASIGVTVYPDDADSVEEILQTADSAMYAAKAAGRNCWRFYEPEMQKDAYDRMVLTHSLRHALERGELYLDFQPQINLETSSVAGFEALLRWNSQEHGLVPPTRFIPLAEQSGLIHQIGEWVVGEACRFARKLTDMGREDLHVAVNVSPRQLATEDFVTVVRRCVSESAIVPDRLEVEITENVLIDSLEDSIRKLNELDELGVRLALDDFGTGYSSLTYLRSLPVKTLKIDKSFIDKILEDKGQAAFIESIIDMAHVLGLSVVAEGVETEPQMLKLTELRCDCVQGYLYSRPVSEDEAIQYLKR